MNYLLDTNHWSFLQRGRQSVIEKLRTLPPSATVSLSVVSQAELLVGIERLAEGKRKLELAQFYKQSIEEAANILPITSAVAERFAIIFVALKRIGRPVATNDIWIAATAMEHGLTLVTNDSDFQLIEGVNTEDWCNQ